MDVAYMGAESKRPARVPRWRYITAQVVHSDTPASGHLESLAPWLDQLFRTIDWGQRGNFISVPTDCPQRDERLGWLGDAQVFARTACYNRDVAALTDAEED